MVLTGENVIEVVAEMEELDPAVVFAADEGIASEPPSASRSSRCRLASAIFAAKSFCLLNLLDLRFMAHNEEVAVDILGRTGGRGRGITVNALTTERAGEVLPTRRAMATEAMVDGGDVRPILFLLFIFPAIPLFDRFLIPMVVGIS